jgi:hypothetical protein
MAVEKIQRTFEPMRKHIAELRAAEISDTDAKLVIYRAFVERELDVPKHPGRGRSRALLRPEMSGVRTAHALVAHERLHLSLPGTGADPSVQRHGEARRVSGKQFRARDRKLKTARPSVAPR